MHMLRLILVFGLVIIAFVGGTVFMTLAFQGPRDQPLHAMILPQPATLPQFSLLDQDGAEFNTKSLRDQWSVLFFGFTHCPDICPATLQQLALARQRVLDGGQSAFPNIVLISVDPERDTPDVMAEYIGHFGDGITGVSGSLTELRTLTTALGIFFEKSDGDNGDDGDYTVGHSAAVIVINKNAEFHALMSAPHNIESFVNDLPLIMEST
jgi:protein SCO1/2